MYALVYYISTILTHESQEFLEQVRSMFSKYILMHKYNCDIVDVACLVDATIYYSDLHAMLRKAEFEIVTETSINLTFEYMTTGRHAEAIADRRERCHTHPTAGPLLRLIDDVRRLVPAQDRLYMYRHHIVDDGDMLSLSGYQTLESVTHFVVGSSLRQIFMIRDGYGTGGTIIAQDLLPDGTTGIRDIIDGYRSRYYELSDDIYDSWRMYIVIVRGHVHEYIENVGFDDRIWRADHVHY